MAKKATVSAEFIAVDTSLGSKIDEINNKLDKMGKNFAANAGANIIQTIDLIRKRITQLGEAVLDFGVRGASFDLLGTEFDNLASNLGASSDQIIESLQATSRNSISERNLILAANRSILLEVADTEEELNKLLEISINRANKLGIEATQAFTDIVTGLGRESALILDNLGIIVKVERATSEYAKTLNKTVTDLTSVERKQALVNAVFKSSEHLLQAQTSQAEINKSKIESLSAAWQDLGDSVAASLSGDLAKVAGDLADVIRYIDNLEGSKSRTYFDGLIKELEYLQTIDPDKIFNADMGFLESLSADSLDNTVSDMLQDMGIKSASVTEVLKILGKEIDNLTVGSESASKGFVEYNSVVLDAESNSRLLAAAQQEVTNENLLFEERMKISASSVDSLAISTAYASTELNIFENRLLSLQRANAAFESNVGQLTNQIVTSAVRVQRIAGESTAKALGVEALERLNIEIAKLGPSLTNGEVSALDLALTFAQIEDDLLSPFNSLEEQNRIAQDAMKSTGKSVTDLASKAEQAFSELQSKVSSVLSSGLALDVGVNPDDILPRADDINENARRIADIAVKGFNSPWYDYIRTEFPTLFQQMFSGASTDEGVKLQAANIIKNFQDGLVPELLDKETAKDRVRRALIGEQNMKELANEIATELASEFGTSVSSIQSVASNVLGGGNSSNITLPVPQFNSDELSEVPRQFEDGIRQSFDGFSERFSTIITNTLSAKVVLENSNQSGKLNGENWGSGFLETVGNNVPVQLIDILTLLILPKLEGELNKSSEREAAR